MPLCPPAAKLAPAWGAATSGRLTRACHDRIPHRAVDAVSKRLPGRLRRPSPHAAAM